MKLAGRTVSRLIGFGLAWGAFQCLTIGQPWAADVLVPMQTFVVAANDDADNTKQNVRDRDGDNLTPLDQSNDKHDVELTTRIRKALVDDDSLSTTAKNIKIITKEGQVTLRGPVETSQEHSKIVKKATTIAGKRVDDQLDVKTR